MRAATIRRCGIGIGCLRCPAVTSGEGGHGMCSVEVHTARVPPAEHSNDVIMQQLCHSICQNANLPRAALPECRMQSAVMMSSFSDHVITHTKMLMCRGQSCQSVACAAEQ